MRRSGLWLVFVILFQSVANGALNSEYKERREYMVSQQIELRGIDDPAVLQAMRRVPRHEFVPDRYRAAAYRDKPLPIGSGQTISQPYIVALMTEKLNIDSDDIVLEIGTGSGYQAAVLAEICKRVYTIEIIPELGKQARERLERLGYDNVTVLIADGYYGWPEHAPYDGIIVTAAASHIPPPLTKQLRREAIMLIPVGGVFQVQRLMMVTKTKSGVIKSKSILPVRFVPLTGEHGEK